MSSPRLPQNTTPFLPRTLIPPATERTESVQHIAPKKKTSNQSPLLSSLFKQAPGPDMTLPEEPESPTQTSTPSDGSSPRDIYMGLGRDSFEELTQI